jgi:cell division septum initiation protein DivIVA
MSGAGAGIAGGQSQSFAALELLADPQRLQSAIEAFKSAEESAREQITLAGPASEILSIRAAIDEDQKAAQEAVDDALDQADAITGEAKNQAELIVEKATQEANRLTEEAASRNEGAKLALSRAESAMAAVESEKGALQVREDELGDVEAALQQQADELASREQELKGDRARLVTARDAINAAL